MNGFCQVRLFQTEADAEAYRLTCDEPDTLHIKQAYIHETPSLMTEEA